MSSKNRILSDIRNAIKGNSDIIKNENIPNFDEFVFDKQNDRSLVEIFQHEFTTVNGVFELCNSRKDIISKICNLIATRDLQNIFIFEDELKIFFEKAKFAYSDDINKIRSAEVSITSSEGLIARTGSIIVSSELNKSRTISIYPPIHIVIAQKNQLFYDLKDFYKHITQKYGKNFPSFLSVASGPSRTADIEKTLVLGAHGPKEVFCFLYEK